MILYIGGPSAKLLKRGPDYNVLTCVVRVFDLYVFRSYASYIRNRKHIIIIIRRNMSRQRRAVLNFSVFGCARSGRVKYTAVCTKTTRAADRQAFSDRRNRTWV